MKMEETVFSETAIPVYQTVNRYITVTLTCLKHESAYQLWRRMELPNCGVPILCTVVKKSEVTSVIC